jgi:hypothetical protein
MTSTVGSPSALVSHRSSSGNGAAAALVICVLLLAIVSLAVAWSDQQVQKGKMTDLRTQYPGVNLELTKRRSSVTYTAGPTHKQCKAGINPLADKYVINVNHQRGVCFNELVMARNRLTGR